MSLIEQWVHDYFYIHIHKGLNVRFTDEKIRKMISYILIVGDNQLQALQDKPLISQVTNRPLSDYNSLQTSNHFTQ